MRVEKQTRNEPSEDQKREERKERVEQGTKTTMEVEAGLDETH